VDNLTVVHEPFDGTGRLAFALLNQLLIEEGFCPTILPNPQELFGGRKTRHGLVEAILVGMHAYIQETKKQDDISNR
jgi:hypothetical protein